MENVQPFGIGGSDYSLSLEHRDLSERDPLSFFSPQPRKAICSYGFFKI